jgi:hypothetical protein
MRDIEEGEVLKVTVEDRIRTHRYYKRNNLYFFSRKTPRSSWQMAYSVGYVERYKFMYNTEGEIISCE